MLRSSRCSYVDVVVDTVLVTVTVPTVVVWVAVAVTVEVLGAAGNFEAQYD